MVLCLCVCPCFVSTNYFFRVFLFHVFVVPCGFTENCAEPNVHGFSICFFHLNKSNVPKCQAHSQPETTPNPKQQPHPTPKQPKTIVNPNSQTPGPQDACPVTLGWTCWKGHQGGRSGEEGVEERERPNRQKCHMVKNSQKGANVTKGKKLELFTSTQYFLHRHLCLCFKCFFNLFVKFWELHFSFVLHIVLICYHFSAFFDVLFRDFGVLVGLLKISHFSCLFFSCVLRLSIFLFTFMCFLHSSILFSPSSPSPHSV